MHYRCILDAVSEEVEEELATITTFTVVGWVGGVEKSRLELTSAKLGLG